MIKQYRREGLGNIWPWNREWETIKTLVNSENYYIPKVKSIEFVMNTVCSLCGKQAKGYARVSANATSNTSREAFSNLCSLLGGVFPFKELVLCLTCLRHVTKLAKELSKVRKFLFIMSI